MINLYRNLILLIGAIGATQNLQGMQATHAQETLDAKAAAAAETCLTNPERLASYRELLLGIADGKLTPEQVFARSAYRIDTCVLERVAQEKKRVIYSIAQKAIANARAGNYVTQEAQKADFSFAYACLLVIRDGKPAETRTKEFYESYSRIVGDPKADYTSAFSWKN